MANNNDIECMLLTLQSENVIVPNASVAEVVPSRDVTSVEDAPDWVLGKMKWRGTEVPLVSFEIAGDSSARATNSTQIAVLYSLEADSQYPYIGLAISGVPHISRFTREQIRSDENAQTSHPMVAQKIRVNGAAVSIVDIAAMEQMVSSAQL